MDFFQSQENARKKTFLLVGLFILAVLLIIVGVYAAFTVVTAMMWTGVEGQHVAEPVSLWSGSRAVLTTIVVIGVVGFSAMGKIVQFSRGGGAAVASSVGGQPVDPATTDPLERRLMNVVEEMAIASGCPVPKVYVLQNEAGINGFAAGNRLDDAAIAITRGGLEQLSREELQGVVAHEFSHILNGDMRLNIRLAGVLFGLLVLSVLGQGLFRAAFHGSLYRGMSRGRRSDNNGGLMVLAALGGMLLLLGLVGQFFGRLIQAAISRQREFLADAAAVQFTRSADGISGALQKIGAAAGRGKVADAGAGTVAHLFFANAMQSSLGGMLSTHPPLPKRIRAIDRNWDGTFTRGEKRSAKAVSPKGAGASGGIKQQGGGRSGRGLAPDSIAAGVGMMAFIHAIGTVSAESVDYARALRSGLPEELVTSIHSAKDAPVVVACLLLDEAASTRSKQLGLLKQRLSADFEARAVQLFPRIAHELERGRMILLELCLPALKQAGGTFSKETFLQAMRELADADGELHFRECLLLAVLEVRLRRGEAEKPGRVKLQDPAALRVLSAFAQLETSDANAASEVFGAATQAAGHPEFKFSKVDDNIQLEKDLVQLTNLSLDDRRTFISLSARIVWHDEQVSPEERELLRALGAVLECPIPPVHVG